MFKDFVSFVRKIYQTSSFIPLHEPSFFGNEKKYLSEAIDSTYVSSVGEKIVDFEKQISQYTSIDYSIAVVNCTSALHLSLILSEVNEGSEVLTQSLNFVAGCNAISYCNASPVFIDIDKNSLCMSADSLRLFFEENCEIRDDGFCWNKKTGKRVSACLPMNTYGFPSDAKKLNNICKNYNVPLIEDSAESLGSFSNGSHVGSESIISTLSFNGNKIITTGGGGMILTNNEDIFKRARHISTTSKLNHRWHFNHDEIGYNYRMPNLNAALGIAQLEKLDEFLIKKRRLAQEYHKWGERNGVEFIKDKKSNSSNYWLNCMLVENVFERDKFLKYTNDNKIMTRPTWIPMHKIEMYRLCFRMDLSTTDWIHDRLINVPSSPI
ncbi:MAG: LegC family aminotransferase [Rickettsiales bacterium TMED289]|nr:MAG: LegC family aminotransferase [Rickettsiales bacterium TMED289]|tara:strand:+ start:4375 stop:5514 length:1140 start_codon:yes stop_codon:yes gene_type:complete